MKFYYYTYLIICTQGSFIGKLYFGQRKSKLPPEEDIKYKGSGCKIKDYLKKYPKGYIKVILGYYNSREELNKAEYNLIHPFLGKEYCLNLTEGGKAGTPIEQVRKAISIANKGKSRNKGEKNPRYGIQETVETRLKKSINMKGKNKGKTPWTKGKPGVTKGQHRVYDNKEHTKWHFEY